MKQLKVLILEDEAPAARKITKLISDLDPSIKIVGVLESVHDGREWFSQNEAPDLIFSDIQLSDALSFDLFSELSLKIPVIFTTAYNEYAVEAFNHFSIDYLLKPIKIEDLSKSISKFREFGLIKKEQPNFDAILDLINGHAFRTRFLVSYRSGLIPINTSEIAYFYSEESVTFLVKHDKKSFILNETLDNLEKQLDPKVFFRANRKFILSASSIKKVEPYFNQKLIVIVEPQIDQEITISKIKASIFKNWLNS